ncbi:hypothetical protein GUITHDRAFT_145778 [Guillardia theta CCMP2712]|uniref:PDZ domain-containing protein n=1 Tax=Guillardia theta (strain CCMP2712) TaxID=905079 RepID=L1IKG7_GUITC|nr:hypothetical protein GUITHDRAFT_145778 [Guillardia theta CCMP2712]EKX36414.1 hypothetical protein GUITHDRAFT_145778 [Guillardia theta CCMP2712]|eukprot:XP_005823394.1 hypothetical protein GUITHDRAFT_145778 [Guillardia theta CCMP2712]
MEGTRRGNGAMGGLENFAALSLKAGGAEEEAGSMAVTAAQELGVGGVGIVLQRDDEHKVLGWHVRQIEVGSSAYVQGDVQLFDVLMAVEGSLVEQMEEEEIVGRILGPVGSTVTLTFGRVIHKERPELSKVVRVTLVRGRPRMQLASEIVRADGLLRSMERQRRALGKDAKVAARSLREASDRVTSLKDERESLRLTLEDVQARMRSMETRLIKNVAGKAEQEGLQRLTCQELHERIAMVQERTLKAREKMMENEKMKWRIESEEGEVYARIEQHRRSALHMKEVLSYSSPSTSTSKGPDLSSSSYSKLVSAYEDNIEELSRCVLDKIQTRQVTTESMSRGLQDLEVLEEAIADSRRYQQGLLARREKLEEERERRKKTLQDLEMKNSSLLYALSIAKSQGEYERQLLADAESGQAKSVRMWSSGLQSVQDLRVKSRESANERIAEIGSKMGAMAAEAAAAHKALDAREEEVKEEEMRLMVAKNKMHIDRARLQQEVKDARREVEDLSRALEKPTKTLEGEIEAIKNLYEANTRCKSEIAASKRRFDIRCMHLTRLYAAQVLRTRMEEAMGGEQGHVLRGVIGKIDELKSMRSRLENKLAAILNRIARLSSAIDRFHNQTHDRHGLARVYLKERERLLIKANGLFAGAHNPAGESNRYFSRRPVTRLLQGPVLDLLKYCDRDRAMRSELEEP